MNNIEIKYGHKKFISPVYVVKRFVSCKLFFFKKESFTIESEYIKINCLNKKEMNYMVSALVSVGEKVKFDWINEC